MLEPYVGFKVVRRTQLRRLCDDQGVIQGVIRRLVIGELSLYRVERRIDQVKAQVQDRHIEDIIC
jgi:hypothetical protein